MRTNEFSKKCFFESLLKISKIKDYNDIDISEICRDAGYNRSTFYRIYKSKDELLVDGIRSYTFEYFKLVPQGAGFGQDYINNVTILFEYIKKDKDIFLLMHKSKLEFRLYEVLKTIFPLPNDYGKDQPYFIAFQSNGLLALIYEWIDKGMKESPEYMGNLMANIIEKSSIYDNKASDKN